ncbi:MAG: amino acid ABC transporter permease [Anaerolineae bacterium]
MLLDRSQFRDRQLTRADKLNWRFMLTLISAVVLLLAYGLPFFGLRVVSTTTKIQEQEPIVLQHGLLMRGQHMAHSRALRNGELQSIDMVTEPVSAAQSSGLAWLGRSLAAPERWAYVSFVLALLIPLAAAVLALILVFKSWTRRTGIASGLIPAALMLSIMATGALVLAWGHLFDFSTYLLTLAPQGMLPQVGFWIALGAALAMTFGIWSLRYETQKALLNWWALPGLVALIIWLLTRARPYPYLEIWNFISDGILVTLRIVVISYGLILLVSLLGGLGRISQNRVIYAISSLYVEIVRGIPLLVQLLFIWFALPSLFRMLGEAALRMPQLGPVGQWFGDLRLSEYTAAVLGLTICYGAYGAEIFRAGISSIPKGQMEAARSLGMSSFQAMQHVILPQAVRVILPPIGNEFVALIKDSSLVSVLAVSDLTRRGREYMARTFLSFDTWIMVALCYLVLTLVSSRIVEALETKTRFER